MIMFSQTATSPLPSSGLFRGSMVQHSLAPATADEWVLGSRYARPRMTEGGGTCGAQPIPPSSRRRPGPTTKMGLPGVTETAKLAEAASADVSLKLDVGPGLRRDDETRSDALSAGLAVMR
jgi:hypothetical protein